jgi:aspartate beta-hydroxylase
MTTLPTDAPRLVQTGLDALRRSAPNDALAVFDRLAEAGLADATVHLGRAYAWAMLHDHAQAMAATDAALALEPRNLRALLLKADLFHRAGDAAAAACFYAAVMKAVPQGAQMSADLNQELARAQAMSEHYTQQFEGSLTQRLAAVSAARGEASPRFSQSVDMLLGKRQIYVQQPRQFYFAELPAIQFHDRACFPWLDAVESATAEIRQELLALMEDGSAFTPYVQRDHNRPALTTGGMQDNPDWGAFYLWKNGSPVPEQASRCPRTLAALAEVPLTKVPGRSPSILFSLLRPGARIPPHTGMVNTRLICHLPLIVPPRCGFRVGNETREWVEGKAWVFDDTIEHEAWNLSNQNRVILLFEVWLPDLTPVERAHVSAVFEAVDAHSGVPRDWSI